MNLTDRQVLTLVIDNARLSHHGSDLELLAWTRDCVDPADLIGTTDPTGLALTRFLADPAHFINLADPIQLKADAFEAQGRWERTSDPVAAGVAWEDYLDACRAAGICAVRNCLATDAGDGRCEFHDHDNLG